MSSNTPEARDRRAAAEARAQRAREAEEQLLLSNSIERVINTSIKLADFVMKHAKLESYHSELASTSLQDWEELKPVVLKLWNAAQEEIRKRRLAD